MEWSTVHISIALSVVCMGVVFVGGWYLQSSLMEERYHNDEQAGQIGQLINKINQQNNKISILNEIVEELLNDNRQVAIHLYIQYQY